MSRTLFLGLILASASVAGTARAESECFPVCREGFVCHEGRCISACNPPCGAGEVCTAGRTCVAQEGGTEPVEPTPPPDDGGGTGAGIPIVEHNSGPQVVPTGPVAVTPAVYASASGYPPPAAQYTAPPPAEPEVYDNNFAIHANPVGFLFFGPVVSLEFGGMLSGLVRARFPNAGLIPALQEFCIGVFEDCEELDFGVGVGGGLRYYIGDRGNLRGFYLGAAFEIEHRKFSRYDSDLGREQERTDLRGIVLGNLGYRFPGRVFLVSLGGEFGAAPGGRSGESAFIGSLVVEIGFHL